MEGEKQRVREREREGEGEGGGEGEGEGGTEAGPESAGAPGCAPEGRSRRRRIRKARASAAQHGLAVMFAARGDLNYIVLEHPHLRTRRTARGQRSRIVHEHGTVRHQSWTSTSQTVHEPFANNMSRSRTVHRQGDCHSKHRSGHS